MVSDWQDKMRSGLNNFNVNEEPLEFSEYLKLLGTYIICLSKLLSTIFFCLISIETSRIKNQDYCQQVK